MVDASIDSNNPLDFIDFVGRFDISTDSNYNHKYVGDWPGIGIRFSVVSFSHKSELINVTFGSPIKGGFYVESFVDCISQGRKLINVNNSMVSISINYSNNFSGKRKNYNIVIKKSTEADDQGLLILDFAAPKIIEYSRGIELIPFDGLICDANAKLQAKKYNMLIVGDSLTAGYGDLGEMPCTYSIETEDSLISWASLVAAMTASDVQLIAWSGKGVVRNYGDENTSSEMPMPAYYNRSVATDPDSYYRPTNSNIDIALVLLGTNDFSTEPVPSEDQFVSGLNSLLRQIQVDYPNSAVGAICSPIMNRSYCSYIQTSCIQSNATYLMMPSDVLVEPMGCNDHPSAIGQQNMANSVYPTILKMLSR